MSGSLVTCPSCDHMVPVQATFCPKCGSPLYLNNRYRIISTLSKGEVSEVFKAEDMRCVRQAVTIKRFLPKDTRVEIQHDGEEICKREVEFLAQLNHHSIPKLYDHFSNNESWYLVRSFLEGETLERRWLRAKRETRLTLGQILDIGIQFCQVLQYLHSFPRPIIFRDLTPSNTILTLASVPEEENFHIYLVDFEGACYLDEARLRSTEIVGTRGYMAPEVAHRRASPRSDIYSLGAILFQLVTGKKPTDYTSRTQRFRMIIQFTQQGSEELWELIKRMMEEDDRDRPYSIMEVKEGLQKIADQPVPSVDDENISAHGVTKRRTVLIASATGITGLLLGSGTAGTFLRLRPHAFTTLTVGSKLDNVALLLGEMYILLLQDASYQVIDQTLTGQNVGIFNALTNKDIDVYPEYLQAGLAQLNRRSTGIPLQDLQIVSDEYQKNYHIVWLTMATQLNNNYCVAMPQTNAQAIGISSLSDLTLYSKQHSLSVAVAPDGMDTVIPLLAQAYGLTFAFPYATSELQSFQDVINNKAQLNICYSTDPLLKQDNFIRLNDDKGALPADSPSPIVRVETLKIAPDIDSILKPLTGVLTTDDSIKLQGKLPPPTVLKQTRQALARQVARDWLVSKGLIQNWNPFG